MNRSPAAQRRTIVIAGGGPVGLSIATLLSSSSHTEDLDIRLFEPRQVPSWEVDTVDLRVYALSRASQSVLENLGVWKTVAAARAAPPAGRGPTPSRSAARAHSAGTHPVGRFFPTVGKKCIALF